VIEIPTTLVLGAGASVAYGLPLNSELTSRLYRLGSEEDPRHGMLCAAGFGTAEILAFSTEFLQSQAPSIDEFLSHRADDFSRIGKAAIAMIIRERESPDLLLKPQDADHWYKYLWERLTEDATFETIDRSKLTVVTFNYDRSLETYLSYVIGARFRKTPKECAESRSKGGWLNIIHVYGEVTGNYGWNATSLEALSPSLTDDALEELHVIPEGGNDDQRVLQVRAVLSRAKRICFLGFGFQKLNLDLLDAKTTCTDTSRPVWGTAHGLKENEIFQAEKRCSLFAGSKTWPRPRRPMDRHGFYDMKCLDLLRESLVLSPPDV